MRGAWPQLTLATALSMIGLFFTGAYILKALRLVLHGPLNPRWQGVLTDMNRLELVVILPLIGLSLLTGLWPSWLLGMINQAIATFF